MPDKDKEPHRRPPDTWPSSAGMFDPGGGLVGIAPNTCQGRPQGDPALCRQTFEDAFVREHPPASPREVVSLNALLLEAFGPEDLLRLPEFVTAHDRAVKRHVRRFDRHPRPDPDPLAYEAAGVFAGRCFRLRLIAVDGSEDVTPRLRLLDREMQFTLKGRKAVRVRGLTPAELDRSKSRARAATRRGETLDRKARDAATPVLGRLINALVDLDRHVAVPRSWHREGFLPADLVGRSVAESAAFIVEYHHSAGFDRALLAKWQACLARSVALAAEQPPSKRRPAAREPDTATSDDVDALMRLIPTGDSR